MDYYLIAPQPPNGDDDAIIAKARFDILQVTLTEDDIDFANVKFGQYAGVRCAFVPAQGEAVQKYRRGNGPYIHVTDAEVESAAEPEPEE